VIGISIGCDGVLAVVTGGCEGVVGEMIDGTDTCAVG